MFLSENPYNSGVHRPYWKYFGMDGVFYGQKTKMCWDLPDAVGAVLQWSTLS